MERQTMMQMDKEAARQFRERWQAVKEIEVAERRVASVTERWQQLNGIVGLLLSLGLSLERPDAEVAVVRQRWTALKNRRS
jgi:hypothetical protein